MSFLKPFALSALLLAAGMMAPARSQEQPIPAQRWVGKLDVVAKIYGPMPTGIAVSDNGRIFINYPRWGDAVDFSVAEIVAGKPVAYPSRTIHASGNRSTQLERIISAQSVVIDPSGKTLWIVDTGKLPDQPISYGGPKLVAVDLKSNTVIRTLPIQSAALEENTYLNDVRFQLDIGKQGYAFITDSSSNGGIIVVDLESGKTTRRLSRVKATMSDPSFYPVVESEILMIRGKGQPPERFNVGSDGIAVTADGKSLFFRSLTSRHLYSIPIQKLVNENLSELDLYREVLDHGKVAGASDGLEADQEGRIYLTDYEHNAIHRYQDSIASLETIVSSPYAIWPDSMSLADNGYLYFTANQLNRRGIFHQGKDLRIQPYMVFRVKTDGQPIRRSPQ